MPISYLDAGTSRAVAGLAWAVTDGRPYIFVVLMAVFLGAVVVALVRRENPEPAESPVFHPSRRPPAPHEPGWGQGAEVAALLLETGRLMEASQAYRRLIAAEPTNGDALFNLGHVYFRLRLYPQAQACWRAVRRLEPRAADARANLQLVSRIVKAGKASATAGGTPQATTSDCDSRESDAESRCAG